MSKLLDDILTLASPGVRGLRPYEPGKPISELEREYGVRDALKLASNENPLGPSPKALEAVRALLPELALYPDGNGFDLKSALAARHGVPPAWITLGNGSNDILELLARAFVTPDNEVLFSEHAFAVYPIVTQAVGATASVAPAKDYGHDLAAMAERVNERTRLVFVANPNNPTGTWLSAAVLERFIADLPAHVIAVVDEAYFEYVQEADYPDTTAWVERFPRLVVTRTFSKAFGLAGLRVGYSVSRPEVADMLNRVRQPFNVNSAAQVAALAALTDSAHMAASVRMNSEGMQQLSRGFADMGLETIPSVGNFLCVDVQRAAGAVYEELLREGVIVRPIANYGLPNHLRITVGSDEQNRRVIAAVARVTGREAGA